MVNIVRNYFRLGPPTGNRDGTGVHGVRSGPVTLARSGGTPAEGQGSPDSGCSGRPDAGGKAAGPAGDAVRARTGSRMMG